MLRSRLFCAFLLLSLPALGQGGATGTTGSTGTSGATGNTGISAAVGSSSTQNNDLAQKPQPALLSLEAAYPITAYPDHGRYDFLVFGQNFSMETPRKNDIWIAGQGILNAEHVTAAKDCPHVASQANTPTSTKPITPSNVAQPAAAAPNVDTNNAAAAPKTTTTVCIWNDTPNELHVIGYQPQPDQKTLQIQVVVDNSRSTQQATLKLAEASPFQIHVYTACLFIFLVLIVFFLVRKGLRGTLIDGRPIGPLTALLLDSQTDTYSLSKFQLFAFCAIFVYGYIYSLFCCWLAQRSFILPDVPPQFTAMLGMSAGTTLAAVALTTTRGTKGAGAIGPNLSDFISQGGIVVPERFFCFVWTLLACGGFLALTLSQDPAAITSFPTFPPNLLYLMGVSSVGYLGGKLTRLPGPVIRNISWNAATSLLIVQGENLSNQGDFFIDGTKLPIITPAPVAPAAPGAPATPPPPPLITSTAQMQAADRSFCTELKITLDPSFPVLPVTPPDTHILRMVNTDGQFADISFPDSPPPPPTQDPANPATPVTDPATPVTDPATPVTDPATPVTDPATPVTDPATPVTDPATPATE